MTAGPLGYKALTADLETNYKSKD